MKTQTFFGGVLALVVGGLFAKFLGAVYKIPLTWILGAEGLGIHQLVFPLFSLTLVLSSLAMPTAVSRLIASQHLGNSECVRILKLSLFFSGCLGLFFCVLLIFVAPLFEMFQNQTGLTLVFCGLAPSVLFVAFISCFRGYFQGKLNMIPTSLSNILEQFFKLLFGLLFAFVFSKWGSAYGVFGVFLGVSTSELLTFLFLLLMFFKNKPKTQGLNSNKKNKDLLKPLLKSFVLISLANAVIPLSVFFDSLMILPLLEQSGLSLKTATSVWGIESGIVASITNVPVLIGLAVSSVLVPVVAKNRKMIKQNISKSFLFSLCVVVPFSVFLIVEAFDIFSVLFDSSFTSFELKTATTLLVFSAGTTIFMTILQIQNAVFMGMGKFFVPIFSMMLGFLIKICLFMLLVPNPFVGIFGVEISKYAFFVVAVIFNFVYFKKLKLKANCFKKLVPTLFASCLMALSFLCLGFLNAFLGVFLAFLVKIIVGIGAYFLGYLLVCDEILVKKIKNWWIKFRQKHSKNRSKTRKIEHIF